MAKASTSFSSDRQDIQVPSGFHDLDDVMGGFRKGDLIIIAARPSMGKTSLSLGMVLNAAKRGSRVGVVSLEMNREQSLARLLAAETGVHRQYLNRGYLNDEEWQLVLDASARLAQLPIFIDDTAELTIQDLSSKSRRLMAEVGVDLVVIDYLQLIEGSAGPDTDRREEMSEITRGLKLLARELNIPIVACVQLPRATEYMTNYVPKLRDLTDIGLALEDADIVMFIHREEMYNPDTEKKGIAELHIARHRNGPLTTIPLRFFSRTNKFADLEVYQQEE